MHGQVAGPERCLPEPDGFMAHESSQQGPYMATSISRAHAALSAAVPLAHEATQEDSNTPAAVYGKLCRERARRSCGTPQSSLARAFRHDHGLPGGLQRAAADVGSLPTDDQP